MKHPWYFIVAVAGFLAGSLVWEMRADYAPMPRPLPTAVQPVDDAERGFLVLVRPPSNRCEVRTAAQRLIATFECRPTGVRW